jgi:hypothetical protein
MKRILSIALLIFMGLSGVAFGQTARDAIEALQKIGARVEVGISYKDYAAVLGEANYKIKPYLNDQNSNKNLKLKEAIQKTWVHYLTANQVWEYQFARGHSSNTPNLLDRKSYIKTDAQFIDTLIKTYPEISQKIQDGRFLSFSDALAVVWQAASTELKYAVKLLALQDNKQPTNPSASVSTKSTGNIESKLDQIEQLKAKGKITDKEYNQMRKEILSEATKSK